MAPAPKTSTFNFPFGVFSDNAMRYSFSVVFEGFEVGAVVHGIDQPAVLMRIIYDARKGCIFKAKTHAGRIHMRRKPDHGMHQLVQKSAVRNDEIFARR